MKYERDQINHYVNAFKSRLLKVYFLRGFLLLGGIALFFLGLVILSLRVYGTEPGDGGILLICVLLCAGSAVSAVIAALRSVPSCKELSAYLESYNSCGGLFIHAFDGVCAGWEEKLPDEIKVPLVRLRNRRYFVLFSCGIIFIILSIYLPVGNLMDSAGDGHLNISSETERLKEEVALLSEEEVINKKEMEKLEKGLTELEESASASDSGSIWESLDNIAESNRRRAEEFAEEALSEMEESKALEGMFSRLNGEGVREEMSPSEYRKALESAGGLFKESKLFQSNKLQNSDIQEMLEKMKSGKCGSKELEEMKKVLEKYRSRKLESLRRLSGMRLLKSSVLKKCRSCSKSGSKKLAEYLKKCGLKQGNCTGAGRSCCLQPGQGGVSRGRGDAPMSYKALGSNESGVNYTDIVLPEGYIDGTEESILLGESFAVPDADDGEHSESGNLTGVRAGQSGSYKHTVLPKHKKIIRQYFNTER